MRLWSLDPSLLDRAALVACWREALLAQKVLAGETTGYRRHPQLDRFRAHSEPMTAIGAYLVGLRLEATTRGYRFDPSRVRRPHDPASLARSAPIPVTTGQLSHELEHLRRKVAARAPEHLPVLPAAGTIPAAHPLLVVHDGGVEDWER